MQIAILGLYTDLVSYAEEKLNVVFNLGNYLYLLDDEMYLDSYLQSIQVATIVYVTLFADWLSDGVGDCALIASELHY